MKKITLLLLTFVLFGCGPKTTLGTIEIDDWRHVSEVIEAEDEAGIEPVIVVITIEDVDGDENDEIMRVRLLASVAPISVENFLTLIEDGFYDGLTMHRIISNFMIQGGNPELTEGHESSDNIVGEFAANGYENDLLHTRGVISMAKLSSDVNNNNYNSAASQFFIVKENYPSLNGEYAAFGVLADSVSYDSLDKIAAVETDNADAPLETITISSIIIE